MTTGLFGLHAQSSLLSDCPRTALPLGTLLIYHLGPVLYGGNKCHTLKEEISDLYLLSGLKNTQRAALSLEHRTLFFTSQLDGNDFVVVSPARRDRRLTAVCSDCTVAGDNF